MTTTPLVFLDTETTGLDPRHDMVWEFAAIRRAPDGTETRHHAFVTHPMSGLTVVGVPVLCGIAGWIARGPRWDER